MSETPYTPSLLCPEECKRLLKSQEIPEKEHKKRGLKQEMIIKDKGRKAKILKERAERMEAILSVESLVLIKYVYTKRLMSECEGIKHPPGNINYKSLMAHNTVSLYSAVQTSSKIPCLKFNLLEV